MGERVYISGAISNRIRANRVKVFAAAEERLRARGFDPVNPFSIDGKVEDDWISAMREDIKVLIDCDAIYLLRGWRNSRGARLERMIAARLGLKIMRESKAKRA